MANNLRPAAIRGTFAAPQPIAVSRKQMFILSLSMPSAADLSRPFQRPPRNSHLAGLLPDSAERPVKRAFHGV